MAQLMKPLLCTKLHPGSSLILKNVMKCPQGLKPLCLGPVLGNERQYRPEMPLERRTSLFGFSKQDELVTRVMRRISTVTGQGDLVYKGRIGHLFRILKVFSLTTSSFGLAVQPYLLITYADMSLAAAIPMFGAINMFVFLNPLLIHYVAKKYVSELYFNHQNQEFTAVLLTFFARKMNFTFKASDVKLPDVPGPFSMLTAKGKPLFVHEADFNNLEVYKHLMGFDKPLHLIYDKEEEDSRH